MSWLSYLGSAVVIEEDTFISSGGYNAVTASGR